MKEVALYGVATAITLVIFIGTLLYGMFQKEKKVILLSFLFLFVSIVLGVATGYKVVAKSYQKLSEIVQPRSGNEIYTALFGVPKNDCVQILNSRDQLIPKIDYAIWMHLKTCPKECTRILSEFEYSKEKLVTQTWTNGTPMSENIEWWSPKALGDTIWVYEVELKEGRNIRTLWISMDSTEVYVRDILD